MLERSPLSDADGVTLDGRGIENLGYPGDIPDPGGSPCNVTLMTFTSCVAITACACQLQSQITSPELHALRE